MFKLKAFTLMELLVGMIISAILISFCYASYSIIYKQYLAYKNIKQQLVKTMELNTILSNDFNTAEFINYEEKKLIVIRKNSAKVEYDIEDVCILRKEREVIDTFNIVAMDINTTYADESGHPSSFLTDFSFNASLFKEVQTFHYVKNYSAETILNISTRDSGNN